MNKFTDDDICDYLDDRRICDNCGACLELSKNDLNAIKIEEISKSVEENEFLETELQEESFSLDKLLEKARLVDPSLNMEDMKDRLKEASVVEDAEYNKLLDSYGLLDELDIDLDSEDALDHAEYLDDSDLDSLGIEEETEEVFPGLRVLKKK